MSKARECPKCGAKVAAGMRFCGRCGADLDQPNDRRIETIRPVRDPGEPRPVETARMPESRSRGARRFLWQYIIVFAVLAAVVAVAIILVIRMNRPSEPAAPSETFEAVHVINANGEEITPTPSPAAEEPEETAEAPAETQPAEETEPAEEEPEATPVPEAFEIIEVNETVYVTGALVNLRTGPGTDYDTAETVEAGTELLRTGMADSWSRVIYTGKEYYISSALVSTEKPAEPTPQPYTVTDAGGTVVVTSSANIRSGPGTSYDVIGNVATGTELSRTGRANGWTQVVYNGSEAFIYDGLIEEKGASDVTEKSGTITVKTEANIRSGPGTDYDVLGTAKAGDTFETTGLTGNHWYTVTYNGQTAYINGNMIDE